MTKMEITIIERGTTYRKGILTLNGRTILTTIEPTDRNLTRESSIDQINAAKKLGKTAIPYGDYEVVLYHSPRFKRVIPLLKNVPGFEMIEMHMGNSSIDSEGCILVGSLPEVGKDQLTYSLTGLRILVDYLTQEKEGMIMLTIKPN